MMILAVAWFYIADLQFQLRVSADILLYAINYLSIKAIYATFYLYPFCRNQLIIKIYVILLVTLPAYLQIKTHLNLLHLHCFA